MAYWRAPQQKQLTMSDFYAVSPLQSNRKLGLLATKINPHYQ
jgi:hypothetical protein